MNQMSLFSPEMPVSWSVTDLTRYVRDLLESDTNLQDVWVDGEVSNLSKPSSGHLYFTLKDENASLRCVMWRNAVARLRFIPRDGDAVSIHGGVSVYEAGGQYQLYADAVRPLGEGALYQRFLRLKAKLEGEGLFDPARKRPIPAFPHRIGIVTSPTGAALQDMLNTIRRRFPLVEVVLAPTPVQGDEAPPGIIKAILAVNQKREVDVIILARGGGSIEDLWAFNDEFVARAIFDSPTPVITGVGHETDFTIADFVADLRAPTPTAAAELATPDQVDLRQSIRDLSHSLSRSLTAALNAQRWALSDLRANLRQRSPMNRIRSDRQRLDERSHRIGVSLAHHLRFHHLGLKGLNQRLVSVNPISVLNRGYAIVSRPSDGAVIRSVDQVSPQDSLNVRVSDGSFGVIVEEEE